VFITFPHSALSYLYLETAICVTLPVAAGTVTEDRDHATFFALPTLDDLVFWTACAVVGCRELYLSNCASMTSTVPSTFTGLRSLSYVSQAVVCCNE
jgi:hypothetical protein